MSPQTEVEEDIDLMFLLNKGLLRWLGYLKVMWQIKCIYGFHECPIFLFKNY